MKWTSSIALSALERCEDDVKPGHLAAGQKNKRGLVRILTAAATVHRGVKVVGKKEKRNGHPGKPPK
jgi:hypothetical protein